MAQNYIINDGTLLEGFETFADWNLVSTGAIADDTTNYKTGTHSLKLTAAEGGNVSASKTISLDMRGKNGIIDIWVYLYSEPETFSSLYLYISSTTDYSVCFQRSMSSATGLNKGWNRLSVGIDEWTNTGGESWDNMMIRLKVKLTSVTAQIAIASVDSLIYNRKGLARCVITFDDARASAYDEGYVYANAKGIKGTFYVIPDNVDTAGNMSLAECTTVYNAGWALGNHTKSHTDLTTVTEAEAVTALTDGKAWLDAQGFTRATRHASYPDGNYNATVLSAMATAGMQTGRTIRQDFMIAPMADPYQLTVKKMTNTVTLATAKGWIDSAISRGATVMFLLHQLVEAPDSSTEWGIADFQALIDYIVARRIKCVTIDEWYNCQSNPRYRSDTLARPAV